MEVLTYFKIVGVVFLVLLILFRKYWSALLLDYGVDGLLSALDTFIGGALGFDIGDFVAAVIIFWHERKIVGYGWALFVAWEALNFIPLGLIPVVGEGVEWFFGAVPMVFLVRIFQSRQDDAEKLKGKIKEDAKLAKQMGGDVSDVKKALKEADEDLDHNDPIHAVEVEQKADDELAKKLVVKTHMMMTRTEGMVKNIVQEDIDAPDDLTRWMQGQIHECENLLVMAEQFIKRKDFKKAMQAAQQANALIVDSIQRFNEELDELEGV